MSVSIKLNRQKNQNTYDIVVTSKKSIETIGYYRPEGPWSFLKLNLPRFVYWVDKGALCSHRVLKLLKI